MTRYLVFIRHSQSKPQTGMSPRQWNLTAEGRRRCIPLAEQLTAYNLDRIVTSAELKAIQTGELVSERLGIPCLVRKNLHEHARETAPYLANQEEFVRTIQALFVNRTELVFGEETGQKALERYANAVKSVMRANPQENIAIVTHGTVLSLFVSQQTGKPAFPFWQRLGMPAITAFSYPGMDMLAQVNTIV